MDEKEDQVRAYARSTGQPCQAKALANGRCKNHGGMSTGPRTAEGKLAVAQATAKRMASGQKERALEGFQAWLNVVVGNTCQNSPNSVLNSCSS